MKSYRHPIIGYVIAAGLAAIGVVVSWVLKDSLGAPNYGLGLAVAVTVICYLYGLRHALLSLAVGMIVLFYYLVEPFQILAWPTGEEWVRIATLIGTVTVTCALVQLLRIAERKVRESGELIGEQNEILQSQNEQLQSQNEEIQAQSEELQAQNEELHTLTEDLRDTQNHLVEALQHETRIAQTLQQAFLPALPERSGNIVLAAAYEAGSSEAEIGGDFYDVFETTDGRLAIAIGDASGKGLHAARQAVAAKYGLRYCSQNCLSPASCLAALNDLLRQDPDFSGFVTLFYGVLDPNSCELTYCTGGHEPPILYRDEQKATVRLKPTGRFLGAMAGGDYRQETVELREGDRLLLFTDGFTEARGDNGLFGRDGLARAFAEESGSGATQDVLNRLLQAAKEHAGGKLADDAAAILLCVD